MVSRPSANRSSPSGEKTGSVSRSAGGWSAAPQSGLSRSASSAMTPQISGAEVCNGLDGAVDVGVGVREREEHRLELRRRDVDPALEQVPEEGGVAVGVARSRVVVVAHGLFATEERQHRADSLHPPEGGQALLEPGAQPLELLVDAVVAEPAQHRES